METLLPFIQIAIAISVYFVWTFRFHNVITEFKEFEISDLTRNIVGVSKVALSTLLIVGIWYNPVVFYAAVLMAFFMLSAQFFHFKVNNPVIKKLPSFILLTLSLIIAINFSPF